MQNIRGKPCLNQTKAWSGIQTAPCLTCLPSQSLSSTHRLDLTASINAKFARETCTLSFQRFPLKAKSGSLDSHIMCAYTAVGLLCPMVNHDASKPDALV